MPRCRSRSRRSCSAPRSGCSRSTRASARSARSSMSATTFAGSAQFAAASILEDGGGAASAIVAALLLNARYVPLSLAVASIFPGSRRRRALESQLIVDESWALAGRSGRFEYGVLVGRRAAPLRRLGRRHRARHGHRRPARPGGDRPRRGLPRALPRPAGAVPAQSPCARDRPRRRWDHARAAPVRAARRADRRRQPRRSDRTAPVSWLVIAVVGAVTIAFKASGPVLLGKRELPPRVASVVEVLAPAMLAALVVTQTVGGDRELVIDERLAGVVAGGIAVWLRAPLLVVMVVAAVDGRSDPAALGSLDMPRVEEMVERVWPGRDARIEALGGGITNRNFKVSRRRGRLRAPDRRQGHGAARDRPARGARGVPRGSRRRRRAGGGLVHRAGGLPRHALPRGHGRRPGGDPRAGAAPADRAGAARDPQRAADPGAVRRLPRRRGVRSHRDRARDRVAGRLRAGTRTGGRGRARPRRRARAPVPQRPA